jgi:hypothetical protein
MNASVDSGVVPERSDRFPLLLALAGYAVGVVACYLIRTPDSPEIWLILLALSGAGALFFLWHSIDWQGHQFDSFMAILLLVSIANRFLYILDFAVGGVRMGDWPVPSDDPELAMLKGEVITVVGIMLTAWGWHMFHRITDSPDRFASIAGHYADNPRGYWFLWIVGVAAEAVSLLYADDIAALGASVATARAAGLMSVLALSYTLWDRRVWRLMAVFVLSAPFIYASLGSGFKENVIFACLPMAIVVWRESRTRRARIVMLVVGAFAIGVVTSYVQYFRARVWTRGDDSSIVEVARGYLEQGRYQDDATEGLPLFLARNDAMYPHGWSVDLADGDQVTAAEIFAPLAYVFVPRMLWPSKPDINPGAEHSERIWGSHYVMVTNSATAAGLYPSFYMGGKYLGVILGSLGCGVLMALIYFWLWRYATRFATGIYAWVLFLTALRLDENWPVFVFSAPIISAAYAVALGAAAVVLSGGSFVSARHSPRPG